MSWPIFITLLENYISWTHRDMCPFQYYSKNCVIWLLSHIKQLLQRSSRLDGDNPRSRRDNFTGPHLNSTLQPFFCQVGRLTVWTRTATPPSTSLPAMGMNSSSTHSSPAEQTAQSLFVFTSWRDRFSETKMRCKVLHLSFKARSPWHVASSLGGLERSL